MLALVVNVEYRMQLPLQPHNMSETRSATQFATLRGQWSGHGAAQRVMHTDRGMVGAQGKGSPAVGQFLHKDYCAAAGANFTSEYIKILLKHAAPQGWRVGGVHSASAAMRIREPHARVQRAVA